MTEGWQYKKERIFVAYFPSETSSTIPFCPVLFPPQTSGRLLGLWPIPHLPGQPLSTPQLIFCGCSSTGTIIVLCVPGAIAATKIVLPVYFTSQAWWGMVGGVLGRCPVSPCTQGSLGQSQLCYLWEVWVVWDLHRASSFKLLCRIFI